MRRADKIAASVNRVSRQCRVLNISEHYRLPRPVRGVALLKHIQFMFPLEFVDTMHKHNNPINIEVDCQSV
jgi:hypothetical protein